MYSELPPQQQQSITILEAAVLDMLRKVLGKLEKSKSWTLTLDEQLALSTVTLRALTLARERLLQIEYAHLAPLQAAGGAEATRLEKAAMAGGFVESIPLDASSEEVLKVLNAVAPDGDPITLGGLIASLRAKTQALVTKIATKWMTTRPTAAESFSSVESAISETTGRMVRDLVGVSRALGNIKMDVDNGDDLYSMPPREWVLLQIDELMHLRARIAEFLEYKGAREQKKRQ